MQFFNSTLKTIKTKLGTYIIVRIFLFLLNVMQKIEELTELLNSVKYCIVQIIQNENEKV